MDFFLSSHSTSQRPARHSDPLLNRREQHQTQNFRPWFYVPLILFFLSFVFTKQDLKNFCKATFHSFLFSLCIYHVLNFFSEEEFSESVSSNSTRCLLRPLWPCTALLLSVSAGSVGSSLIPALGVSQAISDPQQSLCRSGPVRDKLSWSVSECPGEEHATASRSPKFCPLLCG